MGLLLSTLVFCVGVIELINFYHNVRRHVEYPPARSSLSYIKDGYIQELRNTRRKLIEDLERIRDAPENEHCQQNQFPIRDHHVLRSIPTFRLNSHEDIEIECSENVVRSKSTSPRRFLVTEKEAQNETTESRRRFVVSEETYAIRKSKSQSSLPEFSIREDKNFEKSPNSPRYVLQEQQGTSEHPIPLPRQFIVSETELNTIVFQDDKVDTNNKTEYIRRSPSPFPTLELSLNHRNSLCGELIECLSLDSVQEEQKSRSVSPTTVIERLPQQHEIVCKNEVVVMGAAKRIADRVRSKSESDSSQSHSQRSLNSQPKTSSASQLIDTMKVLTKIKLELEEALEENDSANVSCSRTLNKVSTFAGIDRNSSSSNTVTRKNVSKNEIGII